MTPLARILVIAAGLVAVADAVLHLAIGMPEPLRLAGNAIVAGAAIGALTLPPLRHPLALLVAAALNLALNLVFIAQFGIGGLGVVLIVVTTLLLVGGAVTLRRTR